MNDHGKGNDNDGDIRDGICRICNTRTNCLAANPFRWPAKIFRYYYHWGCALEKLEGLKADQADEKKI